MGKIREQMIVGMITGFMKDQSGSGRRIEPKAGYKDNIDKI
jgi:hypothetical protein